MPAVPTPSRSPDKSITVLLPSPQGPNIAADFEKETGIHVDLQTLSWDDIRPKLVTALLAGTAPADVTEFDWSWTGQFNAADWYLPLNNVIDADTVADIAVAKIFTVDGKLLGIPYTNDFRVMLVNKKHFADAGITKMPTTLDELFEDAKQIKAKGIVQYPVGLPLSPDRRRLDQLVSADQGLRRRPVRQGLQAAVHRPRFCRHKALAFELKLLKEGLVDPASTGLKDSQINDNMFAKGLTSIMISGEPGRLGSMNDPAQSQVAGQVEAILVPTASGTTRSYGLPEALGIPKVSQNQDAAIAFVKWFTSKQFQMANYANGVLPTRTSALADAERGGQAEKRRRAGGGVEGRRAALRAGHADLVSAILERGEHRHQ